MKRTVNKPNPRCHTVIEPDSWTEVVGALC